MCSNCKLKEQRMKLIENQLIQANEAISVLTRINANLSNNVEQYRAHADIAILKHSVHLDMSIPN